MRQILYVSKSVCPVDEAALTVILSQSRHNNALDGITGILWSDGSRFAQVLEGDERAIGDAMDRIRADPRHRDIVVLHDKPIVERHYGDWSMEARVNGPVGDVHDTRMRHTLDQASQAIRDAFASLLAHAAA